jgi:thiol-disulfide isomerase/thioredoxin
MKVLFTLLLSAVLVTGAFAQREAEPASKILDKAFAQASKENKKVMVIFHASWCGWCHRMDSLMRMAETKPLFDRNFVTVHLVVQEVKDKKHLENPGAEEFKNQNNGENMGIPFWLVFSPDRLLLGDSRMPAKDKKTGASIRVNTGCPADPEEVKYFTGLLQKTTDLTEPELSVITKVFLKTQPGH